IAISDPTQLIANGVATILNSEKAVGQIADLAQKEEVVRIVVGMPYSADGGKGKKAMEVDEFIALLKTVTPTEIDTWDESYSSVQAHAAFVQIGMKKKKRQQKYRVDEMAARLMLQEYLDNKKQK
ncbi:MAG: Holliday junction resolvase RuvX, partial [Ignavibacteriae bacterium]|nr:Holliday junction resolvase RuvX [Ignavibacteriota bacterium]